MGEGPAFYADPVSGDDSNPGTRERPWRTINNALGRLRAGDTLYLRAGTYFENVYCAVAGTPEKPITIRAFPGERVIVDGGLPEFQLDPSRAWVPAPGGVEGEYVSTTEYRNIRDVVGLFAESNVGLQTYWYLMDLRTDNEMHGPEAPKMAKAVYCGPGLWYDKRSGRIHIRLAPTHLKPSPNHFYGTVNYAGETDPRRLQLVIAPFNSVALFLDQAMHVRFRDIVFRGGGHRTIYMAFGIDVEFDHCAVYGGCYPIWSKGTGPLKVTNCGVFGMIPPWAFRWENCLYVYKPNKYPPFIPDEDGTRHVSRLPTHALLVMEGGYEFETFYYPFNHDWDISYCEFSDSHDGIHLSGYNIRFHHNWVSALQDDGIYVSAPTPGYTRSIHIYQNYLTSGFTAFGAHARGGPGGDVYLYRNIVDLRRPMRWNRPTEENPDGTLEYGHSAFFMHNSRALLHEENIHFYQNTLLLRSSKYAAGMADSLHPAAVRAVFNNINVYSGESPPAHVLKGCMREYNLQMDGNLHWHLRLGANGFDLDRVRKTPISEAARKVCPDGLEARSLAADPRFMSLSWDQSKDNDYRLRSDSPAAGAGAPLPDGYEDPVRPQDGGRPDIGALPLGAEPLRVGIRGRVTAGTLRVPG